jgi:hypothetical protein
VAAENGPEIGPTKEQELTHFWRLRHGLRDARSTGDLALQAEYIDELRVMALHTNNRDLMLRCMAEAPPTVPSSEPVSCA